jgi:hypothetical protein
MSIQPGYASRPTQRVWVLTKADRCDRCGSQAYFHAILHSGNALYFCRHHTNAYLHLLEPLIVMRIDERPRLYADVRDDHHFV